MAETKTLREQIQRVVHDLSHERGRSCDEVTDQIIRLVRAAVEPALEGALVNIAAASWPEGVARIRIASINACLTKSLAALRGENSDA